MSEDDARTERLRWLWPITLLLIFVACVALSYFALQFLASLFGVQLRMHVLAPLAMGIGGVMIALNDRLGFRPPMSRKRRDEARRAAAQEFLTGANTRTDETP